MSFGATLAISFLRAAILVALSLPLCGFLCRLLNAGSRRTLMWLLLLLPMIAPGMLTGFGYANFSLSLVGSPVWNELLYGLLLFIAIVPVGTVLRFFAPPPPVGNEAQHLSQLAGNVVQGAWWRGSASQYFAATALMFLLAFQEFELASLLGVTSWTVWLFDAQAGGLILSESLRYAVIPVLCELIVLGGIGYGLWRNQGLIGRPQATLSLSGSLRWIGWGYLWIACCVFCFVPWFLVGKAALGGISQLTSNFAIGRDILAGCVFAFLATSAAYGLAGLFVIRAQNRHIKGLRTMISAIGLPGLLGSLVLGLSILFLFQLPLLQSFYGTPLPWLAGLFLFLVPRALFIIWIFVLLRSPEANHLTRLLATSPRGRDRYQARELEWRTTWWAHYVAFAILFFWSYAELTIASILAPPGIVTAPVRLYNLMHYGQSAVLCMTAVATFGVPALIFGLGILLRRPIQGALMP